MAINHPLLDVSNGVFDTDVFIPTRTVSIKPIDGLVSPVSLVSCRSNERLYVISVTVYSSFTGAGVTRSDYASLQGVVDGAPRAMTVVPGGYSVAASCPVKVLCDLGAPLVVDFSTGGVTSLLPTFVVTYGVVREV